MTALHPHTQFCLVFDPLAANLTPALDSRFRPEEVVILVCPERLEQAGWLETVLKAQGVRVDRCSVSDAWDVAHIRSCVENYLAACPDDAEIVLNVTGGNKPMTVAAYEAFRDAKRPIFHVHHERDHLVWLYPHCLPSEDLFDRIKLPEFLMVHGAELVGTVDRAPVQGQWPALTAELIRGIEKYAAPLSKVNKYASMAERHLRAKIKVGEFKNNDHLLEGFRELVSLFGKYKDGSKNLVWEAYGELFFPSEKARSYINGGWLEEHVFGLLHKIKPKLETIQRTKPQENLIQDLGRNLTIVKKNNGKPVANELDVALLADNKLHIIECKTKNFDSRGQDNSHDADALYKLDTLRDHIGGFQANAMLVSYKPVTPKFVWRAKDLGIEVCAGKEVQNLESRLKAWIEGGS